MATAELPTRANGRKALGSVAFTAIWIGALSASIAVLGTMSSIGIEFGSADTGGIPLIRAPEGPLWVEPDDDGEEDLLAKLSVNELFMSKEQPVLSGEIVLAKDISRLADEDMPVDDLIRAAEFKRLSELLKKVEASIFPILPRFILSGGIEPASADADDEMPEVEKKVARRVPGSSPPLRRPLELTQKYAGPVSGGVNADDIKADERAVEAGSPLVQLGDFKNSAMAESSMLELQIAHGELIGDRKWIIQKIDFGAYSTFRLRIIGFSSYEESVEFCNALRARNQNCVPANQN